MTTFLLIAEDWKFQSKSFWIPELVKEQDNDRTLRVLVKTESACLIRNSIMARFNQNIGALKTHFLFRKYYVRLEAEEQNKVKAIRE